MLLSIHQPNYWPYPGLIGKIAKSDEFMYLTKVQFEKQSWQNRNRIRTNNGWVYITVPTLSKGRSDQTIGEVCINQGVNWRRQHRNAIMLSYQKAPYYKRYEDFLDELYSIKWESLFELDKYIIEFILKDLDIKTKILYDTDCGCEGVKNELLIDLCKHVGANQYMSNRGSENYIDIQKFNDNNIDHIYIDYIGVEYPQVYSPFEGYLSILDMLMNCGPERTKDIILNDDNYQYSEWNKKIV